MDYRKTLKKSLYLCIGCVILGILLLVASFFLDNDTNLPGYGGGILGVGVVFGIRFVKVLKNDDTAKKFNIRDTDERNIMIALKADAMTNRITILIIFASCIVLELLNMTEQADIVRTLLFISVAINLICYVIYNKKI